MPREQWLEWVCETLEPGGWGSHAEDRALHTAVPPCIWGRGNQISPLHATGHMQLAVLHLTLVQWGADSQMSVLCHSNSKTNL